MLRADVAPGSVKAFAVGPNTLAVYNIDGTFYVTDDVCTHAARLFGRTACSTVT